MLHMCQRLCSSFCLQQAPQLAANMTEILNYNLMLTVNSSKVFSTTVPLNNTVVDIFVTFPTVSRAIFTIYTLSVAAISSFGSSRFTSPVSVGERQDNVLNMQMPCGMMCMHIHTYTIVKSLANMYESIIIRLLMGIIIFAKQILCIHRINYKQNLVDNLNANNII